MNKKYTLNKDNILMSQSKRFKIVGNIMLSFIMLVLFSMSACKKDEFEGEIFGECPVVVSTDPLNEAVDVALNKVISATFNTAMNAATINKSTFTIMQGTSLVAGTVAPTSDQATFTFTPEVPLLPFTLYTGTITTGATDTLRTAMEENYVWTFTTIPQILVSSSPVIGGVTIGGGNFAQSSAVKLTATANNGYVFTNWTENGTVVSTNSTYDLTMSGNKTLVANYILVPQGQFVVNLSASPANGGTTIGAGTYVAGSLVPITAVPAAGYSFVNWTSNGVEVSKNLLYQFTINENKTFIANFILGAPAIPVGPQPINLGSAANYTILAKAGITNTGVTSIQGDIGVSPIVATAITGFSLAMNTDGQSSNSPIVTGKVYAADYQTPTPANLTKAISDMETAFTTANGLTAPAPIVDLYAGNISGKVLPAGLYKYSTGVLITNEGVTLSGGPNDVWVFQIAQGLTVNSNAKITLTGGAQAKNIFWIVTGIAALNTNVDFSGNILGKTGITLKTGTKVKGKLLGQTNVTLDANTITAP